MFAHVAELRAGKHIGSFWYAGDVFFVDIGCGLLDPLSAARRAAGLGHNLDEHTGSRFSPDFALSMPRVQRSPVRLRLLRFGGKGAVGRDLKIRGDNGKTELVIQATGRADPSGVAHASPACTASRDIQTSLAAPVWAFASYPRSRR